MAKPTPQEALALIDRALASISSDRKTHAALVGAVGVLQEAIAPKPVKVPAEEPKP